MSATTAPQLTNGLGETFYVVTMWSDLALDHVTAHVWATSALTAADEARDTYPSTSHSVDIRPGTTDDLD